MGDLELRIQRLERDNRTYKHLCLFALAGATILFLTGWKQSEAPGVMRAKRLEIVDDRGVPLVTLAPSRNNEGGSVLLRDGMGDRKAWFSTGAAGTTMGMISGPEDRPAASLGLSVSPGMSHLSLTTGRSTISEGIENNRPSVELVDKDGKALFTAPWHR